MKILVSTTARRSHLRSLLPFAAAGASAGHEVAVAAPRSLAARAAAAGLPLMLFDDIPAGELAALRRGAARAAVRPTTDRVRLLTAHAARAAIPGLRAAVEDYRPDLIVRDVAELASLLVAQSYGIAEVPVVTTLHSWMRQLLRAALPVLGSLSDHPVSPGGPAAISQLPASFDPAEGTAPLHRFRRPNPPSRSRTSRPLIYVSYGPVVPATEPGAALLRRTVDVLAELPVHLVVDVGRSSTAPWRDSGRNVHPRSWVDQDRVLARASAVVCHGAPGITLAALRAGVPLLVVPQTCDQPALADAVEASGVGIRLDRGGPVRFDPDAVRSAVLRLLAEAPFRARAEDLAGEIAGQPHTHGAVELFEHLAA